MADDRDPAEGLSESLDAPIEEIEARFDEWADRYDADVESWGYRAPAMVAARLIEGGAPSGVVLDAGCGTGLSGSALHDVGVTAVVGIDLSSVSIESARSRGVYRELRQVDLNEPLPFDDDHFAAAISVGVLGYLDDPNAGLDELVRVVRSGGRIVFTQRTDVWEGADFDGLVHRLESDAGCRADVSEPLDYLPGNPEYAENIRMIITALDLPA
jgi:predicted TPR repeat methyltransferase